MLKIWGRLSSINVQKVVWCARELGCRFERVDAGGEFGVVQTEAFGRLNPNRKVPVIEDDGLVLWESNAIVRYLCEKHSAAGLVPVTHAARAESDQWMDWQGAELMPAIRDAFLQLVRTAPHERQPALIEASMQQTEPMMAILDRALRDRPFIVGDHFTMADIPIACSVHRWYGLPIARTPRPHLEQWFARTGHRPAASGVLVLPLT